MIDFENVYDFSLTKEILNEAAGLLPEEFEALIDSYIQRLAQVGNRMGKVTLRQCIQRLRKEAADKKKAEAQSQLMQYQPSRYMIKDDGFAVEVPTKRGAVSTCAHATLPANGSQVVL